MSNKKNKIQKEGFGDISNIIEKAKFDAYRAVNKELINMYWRIGEYISNMIGNGTRGDNIIGDLSDFIQERHSGTSGFSPQNLRRMRQFYVTYKDDSICSTLSCELSWSLNSI